MSDDPVKRICEAWARADYGDECFWEVWPECPTEESLTPHMVLATLEAQAAEIERLRGDLKKAQGALHQIAGKKDYADDPWGIARATLADLTGGKDDQR